MGEILIWCKIENADTSNPMVFNNEKRMTWSTHLYCGQENSSDHCLPWPSLLTMIRSSNMIKGYEDLQTLCQGQVTPVAWYLQKGSNSEMMKGWIGYEIKVIQQTWSMTSDMDGIWRYKQSIKVMISVTLTFQLDHRNLYLELGPWETRIFRYERKIL
jgi:hypothetical protein